MNTTALFGAILVACPLLLRALELPAFISTGDERLEAMGEAKSYTGNALYDYIDGDADRFMNRGFTVCLVRTYRDNHENGREIEVSIYSLGDSTAANSVFRESCGERQAMKTEGEYYCWGEQIFFCCKGIQYAEITERGVEKLTRQDRLAVVKSVIRQMP